jgi:hypothetical protein
VLCFTENGNTEDGMTQDFRSDRQESDENWTVGEILSAMSGSHYPRYIIDILNQVQQWMDDSIRADNPDQDIDPVAALFENVMEMDGEALFNSLEWVDEYADLLPNIKKPYGNEDVVALHVGPADFEDSLRMAIDYAALFNRGVSRRVWMISDTFIIGDVYRYISHIRALNRQGIAFRFLLVTPWGWTEIPLAAETASTSRIQWKNGRKGGAAPGDEDRKRDDRLTR